MDWNAFKELLQSKGKEAVSAALGNSPLGDIINNAPDLFNEAATSPAGQAVANGLTGAPLTDSIPNPGNPVSGAAEGLIAPNVEDAATPPTMPSKAPTPTPVPSNPSIVPPSPESGQTDDSDGDVAPKAASTKSDSAIADILATPNNDNQKRSDNEAALERRKKLNLIPEALANAADAVAGAGSAFGANISQQAGKEQTDRDKTAIDEDKKGFEEELKQDPNSDISKQYQGLLAKFVQKDPSDSMIVGRSASQISEQIPAIEKLAAMQNQKDLKDIQLKSLKNQKDIALGMRNDAKQGEYEKQGRDILLKQLSNRSGGLGLQDAKVNQAIDLQQMMNKYYDPKTDTYTIPPSMHTELAIGLQRLLSPTGQTAQGLVQELQQKTAREGLAGALIYMGMDPRKVGGTTQGVSHLFADAVKRQGLTAEQLRGTYQSQLRNMLPSQLNDKVKQELIKQNIGSNYSDFLPKHGAQQPSTGQAGQSSAPHGNTVKQNGVTYTWNGSNYVPQGQ